MPDGLVSAAEANRDFAKMLREVEGGARITITKDGKPVAVLSPAEASRNDGSMNVDRSHAHRRMMDLLAQGMPLDFRGGVDRDDVHSR
ncbi:type II toxin-antitoxin system Phd/YefM family antitoxin [Azospirillum endophyticum]